MDRSSGPESAQSSVFAVLTVDNDMERLNLESQLLDVDSQVYQPV